MTDRKVLYINLNEVIKFKLNAIASFIISMTPSHPLFPQPLRPSRMADIESGQYNLLELVECCAHLLAEHIGNGEVSNDELKQLAQEADVLRDAPIQAIPGNIVPAFMADLTAIYTHLGTLGDIAYSTRRGSVNLKFPLMVAILYANQVILQEG